MGIKKVRLVQLGKTLSYTHLLDEQLGLQTREFFCKCKRCWNSVSGSCQLYFISFLASSFIPFMLIPYLVFALHVFLFTGSTKSHISAEVEGMERFRYAHGAFLSVLLRYAFPHFPNAYGDIYILHFYFSTWSARSFCTFVQEPGNWGEPLDRAPGCFTEHTDEASLGAGE